MKVFLVLLSIAVLNLRCNASQNATDSPTTFTAAPTLGPDAEIYAEFPITIVLLSVIVAAIFLSELVAVIYYCTSLCRSNSTSEELFANAEDIAVGGPEMLENGQITSY